MIASIHCTYLPFMQHEKLSRMILEKLIYEGNVEKFSDYGITKDHITKIKDMIERSDGFVSLARSMNYH